LELQTRTELTCRICIGKSCTTRGPSGGARPYLQSPLLKSDDECLCLTLISRLNPNVNIERYDQGITAFNAVDMVKQYDVIVDCTDSPSTRYLISDAAVICGKPLVSGSALGTEGQLAVYAYRGGPCYRCVFPVPPPPESVLTCGEGGILGPGTDPSDFHSYR